MEAEMNADPHRRSLALGLMLVLASGVSGQVANEFIVQARQELEARNWAAARSLLDSALALEPDNGEAYYELSHIAKGQDDLNGAGEALRKAIENDPRNTTYRQEFDDLTKLNRAMGKATRAYRERRYDDAIVEFERVNEAHPDFALAFYYKGLAHNGAGEELSSIHAFRKARTLNPADPRYPAAVLKVVATKFNEGNRLFRSMNYDAAGEMYEAVIVLDPDFHRAHYQLGLARARRNDHAGALESLEHCLALAPSYIPAHLEKGRLLQLNGRLDEAEQAFRQAIYVDERSDKAWVALGDVLLAGKDEEGAIAAYEEATNLKPSNRTGFTKLGKIYSEREDWARARKYFETAVALDPDDFKTLAHLASSYNGIGAYDKARETAKNSTRLSSASPGDVYFAAFAWFELGQAEKALGNRFAAQEAFKKARRHSEWRPNADHELELLKRASR